MIKIVINTIEDAKAGKKIDEETTKENIRETNRMTVGILEKGTQGNRTSVMFILKNPDGTFSIAQCTAKELLAIADCVKGAQQRFNDPE